MPRGRTTRTTVTPELKAKVRAMRAAGATQRQTAVALGLGLSTVQSVNRPPTKLCPRCQVAEISANSEHCRLCHLAIHRETTTPGWGHNGHKDNPKDKHPAAVSHCPDDRGRPCPGQACTPGQHHWDLEAMTCWGRCWHCGAERSHKPPHQPAQDSSEVIHG